MRKAIKFFVTVLYISLLLVAGTVVTGLTTRLPVQGPQVEVLRGGGCGIPSAGLPLPYIADVGITLCPATFDYGALVIDSLFWAAILFLTLLLTKKRLRHRAKTV